MKMNVLRHYALVSEMVGVEGIVTAELALMIVNLQSLGVSVALTSVPILASALTSLVLIPLLGYITAKCAKTPRQKALCLIGVNVLQILGSGLVILANILRIIEEIKIHDEASANIENSTLGMTTSLPTLNTSGTMSFVPTISDNNNAITLSTTSGVRASSSNSSVFEDLIGNNVSTTSSPVVDITSASLTSTGGSEGLKFYAVLAIIGYIMSDSGYDTGSCFLKTFALSSTPSRDHPDVIVRAIQMSSVGGILVTLLGAVGIGELLSKGTYLNVNSVTTIFIFALMVLMLLPTAVITLTTGLCCWAGLHGYDGDVGGGEDRPHKYEGTSEEKQNLIDESVVSTTSGLEDKISQWEVSFGSTRANEDENNNVSDKATRLRAERSRQTSVSRDVMERIFQFSQSGAHSLMEEELNTANRGTSERGGDFVELISDTQGWIGKVRRFLKQHEKRLILCMASFFADGALFSFNVYSVNFVTVSICGGDSNAPAGTQEYDNYLRGIKIGSTGLLVFYTSFVIGTTLQDVLLRRLGWWREASAMLVVYIACIITCAIVQLEEFYYVSAFVSGLNRAMVFTVPYILACKILTDNDGDQSKPDGKGESSGDIALVAAMLPLSMTMVAVIIGPMMELTGDAATPIYFSGVCAFLALVLFWTLRKY